MKQYKLTPELDMDELLAHTMTFDYIDHGWGDPSKSNALENYLPDQDFHSDLRNMLIEQLWTMSDPNIALGAYLRFLLGEFAENPLARAMPRLTDLRWAATVFIAWYNGCRDNLTHFAMNMSLCPLHFVDWAICFDDEDPDCELIRRIFPVHHDT